MMKKLIALAFVAVLSMGVLPGCHVHARAGAHGHGKGHSEPCTKTIDVLNFVLREVPQENADEAIEAWRKRHQETRLADAAT